MNRYFLSATEVRARAADVAAKGGPEGFMLAWAETGAGVKFEDDAHVAIFSPRANLSLLRNEVEPRDVGGRACISVSQTR